MEIVTSIGAKIGEYLVAPIRTEFGYLIHYHSNLENLKGEIKKLFEEKDRVQGLVNAAKRNGEVINPDVQSWLTNVNDYMIQKVKHFEDEINKKRRCMYRWSLSRKAYKITQRVLQLQNEGTFNDVARPAPPPEIWSTFKEGFKDFESRMAIMNEVIEGLKKEEVRMIGICGMGGVGKTTMAKEIIKRLAELNLFDKVVMATVSQSPSTRMIQEEIADEIGLKFDEKSDSGRARRLHGRLVEIKRILIVLDDLWTELDFEAVGLPYGHAHQGCKILLTSRDLEVCNRMGSQQITEVPILTTEESWELFRESVGENFDDPDLRSIAKEVVNECGCLPIAIVTVGKALEKKRKHEWVDALKQLRNSLPENIPGLDAKVYSSIKWSYDRLESDEARLCLLLCCLFAEDYDIPIECLVRYGWGRGYFSSSVTLEEARNRVHSLVDKLQRRFLLLTSEEKDATKMHDIVRDVAISIASRDPHGFLITSHAEKNGWPNLATYRHCTTISLVRNLEIPAGLKCPPTVELLQMMDGDFSQGSMDIICNAMKELKVLALVGIESEFSLGVLKSLRTLCLDNSNLYGLSNDVIGGLENLEILSFRDCISLRELPREIGRLKQLRLLDTTNCERLQVIPHGIFSSLCRLEELYMLNSFDRWELATGGEDKRMASIAEVMSLSDHLKVLAIEMPSVIHLLPKDIVLKSLTIRFNIHMDHRRGMDRELSCAFENKLVIRTGDARELMESQAVRLLLKKSEDLRLHEVENVHVFTDLDQEGFQHLKYLSVFYFSNTEYLTNGTSGTQQTFFPCIQTLALYGMTQLIAICPNDQLPKSIFTNLRSLELTYCDVLKYVFSLSVARNLVQLENLSIAGCAQVEEIVSKQRREREEAADMIAFHKLTKLDLDNLDNFVGFFQANKLYSNQEVTTPEDKHQSTGIFENAILPSKCISWLQSLEEVILGGMKRNEVLFDLKSHTVMDGQAVLPIFSQLRTLVIGDCSFTHLWKNTPSGFQGFQNLRYLRIEGCYGLEYVFLRLIAKELLNLQELNISECLNMETIVRITEENEEKATKDMILFPKLNTFELVGLPRLTSLCPEGFTFLWSSTKNMVVISCEKLKTLGAVIPQRNKLENNTEKDSTTHDFNTSPTRSSKWCPAGCGCTPYSRANAHRCIEILPRPINLEVTPTNLEGSNDNDNLENLQISHCASFEVIFQVKGSRQEENIHSVEAFNKLRFLSLYGLPSLTRVWETGTSQPMFAGGSFGNLKSLHVGCCNQLKYLFSSSIAKLLVSIEDVEVSDCASFEVIFQVKGSRHEENIHSVEAFNELRVLGLYRLPSLTRVWETGTSQPMFTGGSFGNLKSLHVRRCNQLKYLFSSSIAKLLVSIEDIAVLNCEQIEEIVDAEEETDEIIALPKLNSLKLGNLSNLKYFCGEAYSLKLPSLVSLGVMNMQNFRIFAPKLIETHPLLQVYIMSYPWDKFDPDRRAEWMGNLNATLRNIYDTRTIYIS